MLNLLWDVPMPADSLLQPFLGMGVGAAWTDIAAADPAGDRLRSTKWNLAYSFIAGLAMPLSDSSRVTAMYRWMQVRDAGLGCSTGGIGTRCLDTNINSSAVDLGYELDL
jgi:opacity protein-like surface antigen